MWYTAPHLGQARLPVSLFRSSSLSTDSETTWSMPAPNAVKHLFQRVGLGHGARESRPG